MVNFKVKKQKGINKVKQKVNQKVSQKVVVNLGDTKPKRRRAPAKPKPKPKEQQLKPPIGLPSQVVMNQPAQNNSLAELLMKNLALSQNVRQEQKLVPEVPPPPKPNELEKPKREILAEKAEARREKELPSSSTTKSLFEFKPAFQSSRDERRAEKLTENLVRFEENRENPLQALIQQYSNVPLRPNIGLVDITAELTKAEPKQPKAELEVGFEVKPTQLLEPVEQGPSLAEQQGEFTKYLNAGRELEGIAGAD